MRIFFNEIQRIWENWLRLQSACLIKINMIIWLKIWSLIFHLQALRIRDVAGPWSCPNVYLILEPGGDTWYGSQGNIFMARVFGKHQNCRPCSGENVDFLTVLGKQMGAYALPRQLPHCPKFWVYLLNSESCGYLLFQVCASKLQSWQHRLNIYTKAPTLTSFPITILLIWAFIFSFDAFKEFFSLGYSLNIESYLTRDGPQNLFCEIYCHIYPKGKY